MHRIDTPTAQADKFGPGKNGFTNGDPATGRRATDLNSDMWDAVQEEICAVVEKSGLVLNKDQHDQLYQAIVKIITSKIPDALLKKNNLSDLVDKALARANLQLKTAAVADVQTSKDDITAGRVLVNGGALALRTVLAKAGTAIADYNDLPQNSVGFGYSDATNSPGFTGSVLDYSGSGGGYRAQLAAQYNGNGNRIAFRTRNGDAAGAWNPWGELYHTRNKPTASDVDAVSATNGGTFQKEVGFNGGLWVRSKTGMYSGDDAAGYTSNNMLLKSWYGIGFYCTLTDANKKETGLTGYINTRTGRLEMKEQIIPGSYTNFDARYYTKTLSNSTFQPKGNYTPAGQAYTKAESDARYNLKNTATKSANAMTHKDASTGVMEVVMSNISVTNNTNVNVTFPTAFPNACVGVVITYDGAGHGSGDDSSIVVPSYSRTGCVLRANNAHGKFMLIAKGY
ncbi:gp53-like domain-containing protein [Enterobacter cancerogenus]